MLGAMFVIRNSGKIGLLLIVIPLIIAALAMIFPDLITALSLTPLLTNAVLLVGIGGFLVTISFFGMRMEFANPITLIISFIGAVIASWAYLTFISPALGGFA